MKINKFFVFTFAITAIFFVSNFINNKVVSATNLVNINTADVTELDTLPGIGPAKAAAIIAYREANGPFSTIEDIMNVSGIGETTFANIRDFITVGDDPGDGGGDGDGDDDDGRILTSIVITTLPTKLSYTIGSQLDISGLVVTGTYDDNATSTETITVSEVSGFNSSVATTSQILTISHNGQQATFSISISGNSSSGSGGTISAHYYQNELSNYVEPTNIFEISAGRDRLSYVNLPINFEAKYKKSTDVASKKCEYLWTFGDGSSQAGEKLEHIYKYVGDYNIVLNGTCGDLHSVSRTIVKVVEANLSLNQNLDNSLQISNQGDYEINLYGWKIQSGGQAYDFPLDTIVSAGKSVTISPEYLQIPIVGNEIILADASGQGITQIGAGNLALGTEREIALADVERFVGEYKRLTQVKVPTTLAVTVPVVPEIPIVVNNETIINNNKIADEGIPLTAAVAEIPSFGFWSKLFHPVRTIQQAFYQ